MSIPAFLVPYDYFITYDPGISKFVAVNTRTGLSDFSDTTWCDGIVESAITAFTNRSASIMFDRSVSVCPNDIFPFQDSVKPGQSTVIKGRGGLMKDQQPYRVPMGTVTVTVASPAVFTFASHGFSAGDRVMFTTTGALPTGLSAYTLYYVIAAGLTTNTFEVSTSSGGLAVNTSGTQSGTHTLAHTYGGPGYTPLTYEAQTILDFSASDIDGIANAVPGSSYRPHQWRVEDILIVGKYAFGANKCSGVKVNKNTGGPSGGRCGLVKTIRVHVQGFYNGIDFGGIASDAGGDSCKAYDCHVHDAVIGFVGGYSESRFTDCDAFQMQDLGYGGDVPAGFLITDRAARLTGCEIEPTLTHCDGVRVQTGGNGVVPFLCMLDFDGISFASQTTSPIVSRARTSHVRECTAAPESTSSTAKQSRSPTPP